MEIKKLDDCKKQGMVKPLGGSSPNDPMNLFWCKHPDKCKSQMSWGTDGSSVCLQSPLYDKVKNKVKKEGDGNEKR